MGVNEKNKLNGCRRKCKLRKLQDSPATLCTWLATFFKLLNNSVLQLVGIPSFRKALPPFSPSPSLLRVKREIFQMSKGPIGASRPKMRAKVARGSLTTVGFLCRASAPSSMPDPLTEETEFRPPAPIPSSVRKKKRDSLRPPELHPSPGCSARPGTAKAGTAGALVGTPGALTDVRVAEGVLGVAGRACARLGAPVPQAPAAQKHH